MVIYICIQYVFGEALLVALIRLEFGATKWPRNLTWGHVISLFKVFLGYWIDCTYQIWVWNHHMTSKWPLNDLKWTKVTWKHNSFTKSPLGHVIFLFIGFWGLKSDKYNRLRFPKNCITCSKLRFSEKVMFSGHCRSLEVIWRHRCRILLQWRETTSLRTTSKIRTLLNFIKNTVFKPQFWSGDFKIAFRQIYKEPRSWDPCVSACMFGGQTWSFGEQVT